MARKVPTWIKVGGLGCVAVVLIVTAGIVGSVLLFRGALERFERADRTMEHVTERYGPIPAFRPDPDGAIRPERMEAFLATREAVAPERAELERSLIVLSSASDGRGGGLRKIVAGARLLPRLAGFLHRRNEALLEAEMGLGEYYYIYTLAYYSWLGNSPADGPPFKLVGERGYVLETVENLDRSAVREYRVEQVRSSLNRLLLPVLHNQQSDLGDGFENHRPWGEKLAAELAALETDGHRLPWQDGLPEVVEASLEPYRDRLAGSYSAMCNAVEIGVARR